MIYKYRNDSALLHRLIKHLSIDKMIHYPRGPFKYYVIEKVGGWVKPNAYVCLHGGWVGVVRCLRNQKITEKIILRFFFVNFCILLWPLRSTWHYAAWVSISSCQLNLMKTYRNEANPSGITKIVSKNFLELFEQSS